MYKFDQYFEMPCMQPIDKNIEYRLNHYIMCEIFKAPSTYVYLLRIEQLEFFEVFYSFR